MNTIIVSQALWEVGYKLPGVVLVSRRARRLRKGRGGALRSLRNLRALCDTIIV